MAAEENEWIDVPNEENMNKGGSVKREWKIERIKTILIVETNKRKEKKKYLIICCEIVINKKIRVSI